MLPNAGKNFSIIRAPKEEEEIENIKLNESVKHTPL